MGKKSITFRSLALQQQHISTYKLSQYMNTGYNELLKRSSSRSENTNHSRNYSTATQFSFYLFYS